MKTKTKALLLALCAILLVVASVFGTMAYLTDSQTVENTFTVGQVHIKLDEAKVNPEGKPLDNDGNVVGRGSAVRVTDQNTKYHLLPDQAYTKDPTITVLGNSEPAYVRVLVTVYNYSGVKAAFGGNFSLTDLVEDLNSTDWEAGDVSEDMVNDTITYEFRYKNITGKQNSDEALNPIFTSIKVPASFTNESMTTLYGDDAFKIIVVANAIQATGFDDADAAWTAFTAQHPNP